MRRSIKTTSFLACFLPILSLTAADPPKTAADYRVLYTGRLYGYFRYPEIQAEGMQACPVSEQEGGPLGEIDEELLKQFRSADEETTVRVAVGDNFAPFILARLIRKGIYLKGKEDAEDVHLAVDNVACFMQLLRLDAVVPGEHDLSLSVRKGCACWLAFCASLAEHGGAPTDSP